ncbi:helix-turn-helix domain-containing protein [Arcobacter cloacae]|uniref:Uncharacterized protein n=1 Tax=Arcobacter cloacae TaxID=1054034 RepID=A0A6M8NIP4_9BACT|nr:helix-turn-helix domain-containing protein [Arcobacter cloacae]QKF89691.1 hypothetical protein ACLO_1189 [Arcobacter cloacae]RXI40687.1 hypothetical protein CP963_07885 [Arcobacter cloacae]
MHFENIMNRLFLSLGVNNSAQFCELIGVNRSVFSNWKTRGKIPYEEIISLCNKFEISSDYIFFDRKNTLHMDLQYTLKGRLYTKTKDSSLKYFQSELLLLHDVLSSNILFGSKNELVNFIQNYKTNVLDQLIISNKTKDNVSSFIYELTDEEFEYLQKNKDEFLLIMFEFRNWANKLFTFHNL